MRTSSTLVALGATGLAVFMCAILGELLIYALIPLTGSWFMAALIAWSICVVLFSATAAFASWVLHRHHPHSYSNDLQAPQLSTFWSRSILGGAYFQQAPAWAHEELPAYRTRVELLNETSPRSTLTQHTPVTVATVANSKADDYTFATSPFTSPPVFAMQIFISKELVISDEVIPTVHVQEVSVLLDVAGEIAGEHML